MKKLHTKDVDALFEAILSLKDIDECYKFFEDACTVKEILDIAQRLKAAKMLKSGKNYLEVCAETGMSAATIARVSRCLEYGDGGYDLVIERTESSTENTDNSEKEKNGD
jgi:TrpR-related protein YerC/YecD